MKKLTAERLRELLHYCQESGKFIWRDLNRFGVSSDGVAGYIDANGYVVIRIDYVAHKAHRLAWLYVNGKWPSEEIDHRNRIRHDNRYVNLREATHSQNGQNKAAAIGAVWRPHANKWWARIRVNGTRVSLGMFATKEEAAIAYRNARIEMHDFAGG